MCLAPPDSSTASLDLPYVFSSANSLTFLSRLSSSGARSIRLLFLCRPEALSSRSRPRARLPQAFAGDTIRGGASNTVDRSIFSSSCDGHRAWMLNWNPV